MKFKLSLTDIRVIEAAASAEANGDFIGPCKAFGITEIESLRRKGFLRIWQTAPVKSDGVHSLKLGVKNRFKLTGLGRTMANIIREVKGSFVNMPDKAEFLKRVNLEAAGV